MFNKIKEWIFFKYGITVPIKYVILLSMLFFLVLILLLLLLLNGNNLNNKVEFDNGKNPSVITPAPVR
ncbi:MAG: hypothetical protein PHP62_01185 [Candidatus Moranbacteria bacterium]|nr:hypothetical protein [Candidatus Moranbacteria bacterium]